MKKNTRDTVVTQNLVLVRFRISWLIYNILSVKMSTEKKIKAGWNDDQWQRK